MNPAAPVVAWWIEVQRLARERDYAAGVEHEGIPPNTRMLRVVGSDVHVTAAQLDALAASMGVDVNGPVVLDDDDRLERARLAQAHHQWGPLLLGNSQRKISTHGCALTTVVSAARWLGSDLDATPASANTAGRLVGAFVGASIDPVKLAPALGLRAGLRVSMDLDDSVTLERVAAEVDRVLADGGVAMLHVDTDDGRPDTSPEGNHYVLAVGYTEDRERIVTIDPAGGRVVKMDRRALDCPAPPGRPRPYKGRGARGLYRLRA